MSIQTMKRLISFKFNGIKVTNLQQVSDNKFKDSISGRLFLVAGAKDISEVSESK